MGDVKKAIISLICIGLFVVLWKMGIFENRLILAAVGGILGLIAYKLWSS